MKNQIRDLRREQGLSQEELARRCGVSRQTINAIENNKYDPTLALAFHLAAELGVRVELNTPATAEIVRASGSDTVILATGSRPVVPDLGTPDRVRTAADVLMGGEDPGKRVVVVGGGLVGCELALWLRKQDSTREVTLVEALPDVLMVGTPVCDANTDMLKALLPFHGVIEELGARVVRTEPDGVVLHLCDGSEQKLEADTIAVAVGYRSENRLFQELQGLDAQLFQIGDANKVANIHYAIWDAYEVARGI